MRMFTGIVKGVGTIKQIEPKEDGYFFSIESPLFLDLAIGGSVSIHGVCLTIVSKDNRGAQFEVMPETLKKTALGQKQEGDGVNIEPSLRMGEEVGGHIVTGHVDGVGTILEYTQEQGDAAMTIEPPYELMKYIAPRGSVAVDGVSLTIARVAEKTFTVFFVEYTLEHTTFGNAKKGGAVHIETDMLAKYVESLIHAAKNK